MEIFKHDNYKLKKRNFLREYTRVEPYRTRRDLTKNVALQTEYKEGLVETYNELTTFLASGYETELNLQYREYILGKHESFKEKLKLSFDILGLTYEFEEENFALIDVEQLNVSVVTESESSEDEQSSASNSMTDNSNITVNMTQTTKDFITMANHMIGSKYDGDPINLDSFLDSVALLIELCENNNRSILLKFVLTRLEGRAREVIPDNPTTVQMITDALKANIKNEPSKVIEGRILALRAERNNLSKFAEKAEELAEQFRRSLCTEGFTKEKAKEMAIEKTVEMCRKSAKYDSVKTVLASTKFEEPKEVIAKMIIETNTSKQEQLEAQSQKQFQNHRGNKNGRKNGNNFNRGNGHRNDNNSQRDNSQRDNRSNNGSYRNNQQNFGTNNQNRSQNHGNGYNNNNRGNYNNQNRNGNRNNSNVHTIRFVSGNEETSQAERQEIPL